MEALLYFIGTFALIKILQFAYLLIANGTQEFKMAQAEWIPAEQQPKEYVACVPTLNETLQSLGFQLLYYQKETSMNTSNPPSLYAVYWNNDSRTIAYAESLRKIHTQVARGLVKFETTFSDGFCLISYDNAAHLFITSIPNGISLDKGLGTIQAQYEAHCNEVLTYEQSHGKPKELPSLEETKTIWNEKTRAYIDHLVSQGIFKKSPKADTYKMSLRQALSSTLTLLKNVNKAAKKQNKNNKLLETAPLNAALEIASYQAWKRAEQDADPSLKKHSKLWLFAISALLFAASISTQNENIFSILALMVVIFFHELGHIIAMRIFGHKNTSILFVPFLGALAVGNNKVRNTPWQRVLILLAGPMPGIVLATLAYSYPELQENSHIAMLTSTALIINYFNLLPIVPLDGGRVISEVISGMGVILPLLFQLVGFLLLIALTVSSGISVGAVLISIVGLMFIASLRTQYTQATIIKEQRRQSFESEEARLTWLFQRLSNSSFNKLNSAQRFQRAQLIEEEYEQIQPRWYTRLLLLFIYLLAIALPPTSYYIVKKAQGSLLVSN